jgi:hypothetical protein
LPRAISRRTAILSAASYTRVLGANDRIQAGLIGCGNLGMRHLRIYQKPMVDENKVRFAAISDIYTAAKRRAQQHIGLATPFAPPKTVYLEKPMAFTIGSQWCSASRYHAAREVIQKGR